MSTSRFTWSPTFFKGIITCCWVWAIIMIVNVWASSSTSHTVKDVPSRAMKPFGMMYLINWRSGTWNLNQRELPSGVIDVIVTVQSTWPCTMCPPNRFCASMARSRLTLLPTLSSPRFVRRKLSGATPTLKVSLSNSVTVKQVPAFKRKRQKGIC